MYVNTYKKDNKEDKYTACCPLQVPSYYLSQFTIIYYFFLPIIISIPVFDLFFTYIS